LYYKCITFVKFVSLNIHTYITIFPNKKARPKINWASPVCKEYCRMLDKGLVHHYHLFSLNNPLLLIQSLSEFLQNQSRLFQTQKSNLWGIDFVPNKRVWRSLDRVSACLPAGRNTKEQKQHLLAKVAIFCMIWAKQGNGWWALARTFFQPFLYASKEMVTVCGRTRDRKLTFHIA